MDKKLVFEALKKNVLQVLPKLSDSDVVLTGSLKALGANSIDRAEIIMMTMESLSVRSAMADFASAKNISDLCDLLLAKHQEGK
jgi:polyketide biosynthesis acyl carrier protein